MGAALGCLAAQAASCFTSAACTCACKLCKISGSIATRLAYAAIFLTTSLTAWTLTTRWAVRKLEHLSFDYLKLQCPEGICYGMLAVHRVCFALTLFHILLACTLVGVNHSRDPRAQIQNGWWGPKVLTWISLTTAAFFIPNGFFIVYGNYIAVIGAGAFIILQMVLLVDFAHTWSETCMENWEDTGDQRWQIMIVGGSVGLYATAITLTGIIYGFFGAAGCSLNMFLVSLNLVLGVITTLCSVHPFIQESNPRSGLSQSAMVFAYTTYLIMSAVANEPQSITNDARSSCNPIGNTGTQRTSVIIGALFTLLALVYSTSRAATQGKSLINASDYEPVNAASAVPLISNQPPQQTPMRNDALSRAIESGALPASALDAHMEDDEPAADDEREGTTYNYAFFHLIFAIASMYVAMLLTNWNTVDPTSADGGGGKQHPGGNGDGDLVQIGQTMVAVWVKAISGWVCIGLYLWTLLAPVLFPERFAYR